MNRILRRFDLADRVVQLDVEAPRIAKKRRPGQFVIVRVAEGGERIPLTIADAEPEEGSITLVVQVVGKTTTLLSQLQPGDSILDLVGPLGKSTVIDRYGRVAVVAGGIGVAPLFPIAKALREAGNSLVGVLGARTKALVVWEDKLASVCDELLVTTDDGSYGRCGRVTDALQEVASRTALDFAVAIGPAVMMKAVCDLTRPLGIPTVVSLNPIMVDGTGMCGGCRVLVGGQNRFVCVDGPEFDGHLVDFDNLIARLNAYKEYEAESLRSLTEGHRFAEGSCRLSKEADRAEP